jgi:hypothetical protein
MRKILVCTILLLAGTIHLNAQDRDYPEQSKPNQAIIKFFDGVATVDTTLMKKYTTDNFLLLEDGMVWNLDTLTSKLKSSRTTSFKRINDFKFIKTTIKGKMAWVAYYNSAEITSNGNKRNLQWMESAVLVKHGKDWKIQLLHSTRLKGKAE